jgi:hypothetical protein
LVAGEIEAETHCEFDPEDKFERSFREGYSQPKGPSARISALSKPIGMAVLFLGCCVMLAVLPDGMSECMQAHAFDTCHSTLNR